MGTWVNGRQVNIGGDVVNSVIQTNGDIVINGVSVGQGLQGIVEIRIESEQPIGSIKASGNVSCSDVNGNITCDNNVKCAAVIGNVTAGNNITAHNIQGDVEAGNNLSCENIGGSVKAGNKVSYTGKH